MARSVNSTADEIFVLQSQPGGSGSGGGGGGGGGSIGDYISIGRTANSYPGKFSIAVGEEAEAVPHGTFAQGVKAKTFGLNSLVLGTNVLNASDNSIIVGKNLLNGHRYNNVFMYGENNIYSPYYGSCKPNLSNQFNGYEFIYDYQQDNGNYDFSKYNIYYYSGELDKYYEDYSMKKEAEVVPNTFFIRIEMYTDEEYRTYYRGKWYFMQDGAPPTPILLGDSETSSSKSTYATYLSGDKNYLAGHYGSGGINFSSQSTMMGNSYSTIAYSYYCHISPGSYNTILGGYNSNIKTYKDYISTSSNYNTLVGPFNNIVNGYCSSIYGNNNSISPNYYNNTSSNSTVIGSQNRVAYYGCCTALGDYNNIQGKSIAVGHMNTLRAAYNSYLAVGDSNNISHGDYDHSYLSTFGYSNKIVAVDGDYSIAAGSLNTIKGVNSFDTSIFGHNNSITWTEYTKFCNAINIDQLRTDFMLYSGAGQIKKQIQVGDYMEWPKSGDWGFSQVSAIDEEGNITYTELPGWPEETGWKALLCASKDRLPKKIFKENDIYIMNNYSALGKISKIFTDESTQQIAYGPGRYMSEIDDLNYYNLAANMGHSGKYVNGKQAPTDPDLTKLQFIYNDSYYGDGTTGYTNVYKQVHGTPGQIATNDYLTNSGIPYILTKSEDPDNYYILKNGAIVKGGKRIISNSIGKESTIVGHSNTTCAGYTTINGYNNNTKTLNPYQTIIGGYNLINNEAGSKNIILGNYNSILNSTKNNNTLIGNYCLIMGETSNQTVLGCGNIPMGDNYAEVFGGGNEEIVETTRRDNEYYNSEGDLLQKIDDNSSLYIDSLKRLYTYSSYSSSTGKYLFTRINTKNLRTMDKNGNMWIAGSLSTGGSIASAQDAHAEGGGTKALGVNSHSEGGGTQAQGENSHSEGGGCFAYDRNTHAEGGGTHAYGDNAHAEGGGNIAGDPDARDYNHTGAHAEGGGNWAQGNCSHAEGGGNLAGNANAHAEGGGTSALGYCSHTEGGGNIADGNGTHAEGGGNLADGNNTHAEGGGTKAFGSETHAEGAGTVAMNHGAHAEGGGTWSIGNQSHAEGGGTVATNNCSHAEGADTYALNHTAHAEGNYTEAWEAMSHAEGYYSKALGAFSHAEGGNNVSDGEYVPVGTITISPIALQESDTVKITGPDASGNFSAQIQKAYRTKMWTTTHSNYITTLQYKVVSTDLSEEILTASIKDKKIEVINGSSSPIGTKSNYSYLSNINTTIGAIATADLLFPVSSISYNINKKITIPVYKYVSNYSYTLQGCEAHGTGSHAEGCGTSALSSASHAEGAGTIASSVAQHVSGKFNIKDNTKAVIVGNGNYDAEAEEPITRSNAYTLDWEGNAEYAGDVTASKFKVKQTLDSYDDDMLVPFKVIKECFDWDEETGTLNINLPWLTGGN